MCTIEVKGAFASSEQFKKAVDVLFQNRCREIKNCLLSLGEHLAHLLSNAYLKMEFDAGAMLSLISSGAYHQIAKVSPSQMEPLKVTAVHLKRCTCERINILEHKCITFS